MIKNIKYYTLALILGVITLNSCKKEEYAFGDIKAPSSLTLSTSIVGVDAANPNGNGTGNVAITATATDALTYTIDFGDGTSVVNYSGALTHKYTNPGTYDYTVVVNAIGTGGAMSTISKKIKVFVAFEIPTNIITALTGGSSKKWIADHDAPGHFGVGPTDQFAPIWYAATPNSREDCAYDDVVTFSVDANNAISMSIDNKGTSMSIGAATAFYGFSGGDGCYAINTGGTKKLAFMDATSSSTAAESTRIQFNVPGNGIIIFGTGGTMYEILSFTANTLSLRSIGSDGNAWYQKLTVKP